MSQTIHIGIFIDGTGNHRKNDERIGNGTQSNVAKLSNVFEKTPAENCEIYVEYLHNGAYDITKKIKMYDEFENLVHSKKQPLDGL